MLEQRRRLPVFRMIALQAFDEGDNQLAVEVSIFAITFFGAAPAWVAAQVGIRGAHDERPLMVFIALKNVAGFVAFDRAGLFENVGVPGFAEPNALRESGGRNYFRTAPAARPALRQAVNAFDVTASLDAQTRHARV